MLSWGRIKYSLEKRIKISTQGRLTIPKTFRDSYGIKDGQPIVVKTGNSEKEIVIEVIPTITDFS